MAASRARFGASMIAPAGFATVCACRTIRSAFVAGMLACGRGDRCGRVALTVWFAFYVLTSLSPFASLWLVLPSQSW
jgi:hypothetical protein